jgi:hypothetical protein
MLLAAEAALLISLLVSGPIATNHAIRSLMLATAAVLPLIMAWVLLYRVRVRLSRSQYSRRAYVALQLVVISYFALLPLLRKPRTPNLGPLPLSKSVTFEVFEMAATEGPNGLSFVDPDTGTPLPVIEPPIITAADVLTVELRLRPIKEYPSPTLLIFLRPIGGKKLLQATTRAHGGRWVIVADERVLDTPNVMMPIDARFQLTGGKIRTESHDVFKRLTAK